MWHAVAARQPPDRRRTPPGSPHARWPTRPPPDPRSRDTGTPADVVADDVAAPRRSDGPRARPKNGLDRYFEISARRSTLAREVRGGLTTFFTMAYIVVLNPIILSGADVDGNDAALRRRSPRSPR